MMEFEAHKSVNSFPRNDFQISLDLCQPKTDQFLSNENFYSKSSPLSTQTPSKDSFSPESTEPNSMPSDKSSNSQVLSEDKSELTDSDFASGHSSFSPNFYTTFCDKRASNTLKTNDFTDQHYHDIDLKLHQEKSQQVLLPPAVTNLPFQVSSCIRSSDVQYKNNYSINSRMNYDQCSNLNIFSANNHIPKRSNEFVQAGCDDPFRFNDGLKSNSFQKNSDPSFLNYQMPSNFDSLPTKNYGKNFAKLTSTSKVTAPHSSIINDAFLNSVRFQQQSSMLPNKMYNSNISMYSAGPVSSLYRPKYFHSDANLAYHGYDKNQLAFPSQNQTHRSNYMNTAVNQPSPLAQQPDVNARYYSPSNNSNPFSHQIDDKNLFTKSPNELLISPVSKKRIGPTPSQNTPKPSKKKKTIAKDSHNFPLCLESIVLSTLGEATLALSNPSIEPIGNILSPKPHPKFINPSGDQGVPERIQCNNFLEKELVDKCWATKYSNLGFSFKSVEKKMKTESDLYDYFLPLLEHPNMVDQRKKLANNNFLINATKRSFDTAIQSPSSPLYSSPCPSPTDYSMLEILAHHATRERSTTPPLESHKLSKLDKKKLRIINSESSGPYLLERAFKVSDFRTPIPELNENVLICTRCCLPISPRETALYSKPTQNSNPSSNSSSVSLPLPFCSLGCLRVHHQTKFSVTTKAANSFTPASFFFSPVVSAGTHPFVGVPVIIENPSLTKSNKILLKYRRKSGEGLDSAQKLKTWRNVRWMKYSPLTMAQRRQRIYRQDSQISISNQSASANIEFSNSRGEIMKSEFENHNEAKIAIRSCFSTVQKPASMDTRICQLCSGLGEGSEHVEGRLLNLQPDMWIHLNCVLWSYGAYETVCGSLVETKRALNKAFITKCTECHRVGAGLPCYDAHCSNVYHLPCAHRIGCSFYSDKSMFCPEHSSVVVNSGRELSSLRVPRRVYIERDENALVARVLQGEETTDCESSNGELLGSLPSMTFRVGSMVLYSVGQLLPEQLASGHYHNWQYVYPVGYHISRFYWSDKTLNQRTLYHCRIEDMEATPSLCEIHQGKCRYTQRPNFIVEIRDELDPSKVLESYSAETCSKAWKPILQKIAQMRSSLGGYCLKLFPDQLTAENLFGLNEPHVLRAIESLPGIEHIHGYSFKFGRTQLISEMPLAINPTGCARSEPSLRTYVRRSKPGMRIDCLGSSSSQQRPRVLPQASNPSLSIVNLLTNPENINGSISKNVPPPNIWTVQSRTHQLRRLRTKWKTNVVLGRSRIQGLGLYASKDLERHSFIIEYLGETIRNEVGNKREQLYESQNRGIYMFRASDDCIVDATMCGGLARYINHSCEPNCMAEVVHFDNMPHIIIIANRRIEKGEELTYDYKFDFEEDRPNERIPCLCGATNCRKWMN